MQRLVKTLLFILFILLFNCSTAQIVEDLNNISFPENLENIFVKKLHSDKNSSSFVIWVKNEVKKHVHEYHSEHVYILEGEGIFTLGEKEIPVKAGDILFIPENTPHAVKVSSSEPMKVISIQSPEFKGEDRKFLE